MPLAVGMRRCGGGEGQEAHPFRWLDVVRYAAASMVTVLILIVVVKATKVVLFPDSLYVSVLFGSVRVTRAEEPYVPPYLLSKRLVTTLRLRVGNPERHARMYYVNVQTYLFDNDTPASSSNPAFDCIAYLPQEDIVVRSQDEVDVVLWMQMVRELMEPKFFDLLYNNEAASMSGVTMRMDATLLTESGGYNTSRRVTYYCWPLVILQRFPYEEDDVFCRDVRGSHFI